MRRNLRGPGMAVGIDYLAKKFEQTEADLVEALKECGFTLPASAKDEPAYLEYDGDLYWLNLNHRGQLWINTREKPRAVFRAAHGQRVASEAPPPEKEPTGVEMRSEDVARGRSCRACAGTGRRGTSRACAVRRQSVACGPGAA